MKLILILQLLVAFGQEEENEMLQAACDIQAYLTASLDLTI